MVYSCAFRGCKSTSNLFSLPPDPGRCRQWLMVLGRPEDTKTSRLRVCREHFSPECFENYTEAQMGFTVRLRLRDNAVPNPKEGPPSKIHREASCQMAVECQTSECQARPSVKSVACQTSRLLSTQDFSSQINRKPEKRSKAVQARAPGRSVACDTSTLELLHETASRAPLKRARSDDDPSGYPSETLTTIMWDGTTRESVVISAPENHPIKEEQGEEEIWAESWGDTPVGSQPIKEEEI